MDVLKNPIIPFVEFYLKKYCSAEHTIVDIGCGTAQYRHVTPAHYIGIDITDEPYVLNYPRDVDIVASATELPMTNESCDLVFSVGAFYQIPEYSRALMEFYRVLKPRGRLLLFDYNKRTQKRIELLENHERLCWTQWGLKRLVKKAGFRDCELLLPYDREITGLEWWVRLVWQELRRTWAIVTGIK